MRIRRIAAALIAAGLAVVLTGCGDRDDAASNPNTSKDLVVGIYYDHPGWGERTSNGGFSGFDVDMARYLARGLGYSDSELKFKSVTAAQRVPYLQNGTVDMVLANLSYTPDRAQQVALAGPYFVAGQDVMVQADNRTITGPHSLDGSSVCAAAGTTSAANLQVLSPRASLQQLPTDGDCVQALLDGKVDAVTGDDAILAGFAQQTPKQVKVLGAPFSTELYSVGLPSGSNLVNRVDQLISQSYGDGSWQAMFDQDLGTSGLVDNKPTVGDFTLGSS